MRTCCAGAQCWVVPACAAVTLLAGGALLAPAANEESGGAAGAPLRVVARTAAPIYQEASRAAAPVRMASPLEPFVVVATQGDPAAEAKDRFCRVAKADTAGEPLGWMVAQDVVPWGHRILLGRLRPAGPAAAFFQDRQHLLATYAGTAEGVPPPIGREVAAGGVRVVLPLLAAEAFERQGDKLPGFRVACVQAPSLAMAAAKAVPDTAAPPSPRPCDIVFVIDTTSGNASLVDAVRQAVTHLTADPDRLAADQVRFALVGFRDVLEHERSGWYVAKLFCDLDEGSEPPRFAAAAAAMVVAEDVPDDDAEDVLAGLKLGISGVHWAPSAFKHLLLVGDAAAQIGTAGRKNPERLTIEQITQTAQPRGIAQGGSKVTLHGLLRGSEPAAVEHFRRLAAGEDFIGRCGPFDGPDSVEQWLRAVLTGAREAGRTPATVVATARPEEPAVLTIARSDPGRDDEPLPFAEGFAAPCDAEGTPVLEPYVLVSAEQLGMYVGFLDFAIKEMRSFPADRISGEFKKVQTLQVLTAGLLLGVMQHDDLPAAQFAKQTEALPVRSRLMELTADRAAAMSDSEMMTWLKEIETRVNGLQKRLVDERSWFLWEGGGPATQKYGFLPLADLP